MNSKVCCFNGRLIILLEAPKNYIFAHNHLVNRVSFRQTNNLYPNFIQKIANSLERVCKQYKVVSILYSEETIIMHNFINGTQKNITYYVYYTTMDDCLIDNVFYDELLEHLTTKVKMSYYVSQVFLQSLRHGFNKPDNRIDNIVAKHGIRTKPDNLGEIRRLVLNLTFEQKKKIEIFVSKNSTFDSILPNMLLLNVTNCIQQESLSIKHNASDSIIDTNSDYTNSISNGMARTISQTTTSSSTTTCSNEAGMDTNENNEFDYVYDENKNNNKYDDDDDDDDNDIGYKQSTLINTTCTDSDNMDTTTSQYEYNEQQQQQCKFRSYVSGIDFQHHYYYCSYGCVVIVEAVIQMSAFHNLILKNIISAFLVKDITVDQLHIYLYIDEKRFEQFSKMRIHGKILQYTIHNRYTIDTKQINIKYDIDFNVPTLFSAAPLVIAQAKNMKESFKSKVKLIQIYLIVCTDALNKILTNWNCTCKILRIITSPYEGNKNTYYHILVYINEHDTVFLYEYLPQIGMNNTPCHCTCNSNIDFNTRQLPHSQKLWQSRPCIEILFHTHFDWTIMQIHNDFMRRPGATNIFKLYDVYESDKVKIAHLLDTKVFKVAIENLTTFKFYTETGILYPFETSGHEELYIYTLIKMTRIIYRCIVMPLMKLEKMTSKCLLPSKFLLTYAFIDDPLTPTTSVRGPQSTRNLKSIENEDKLFDTKVINVTMLMNSFNLCGSESIENSIKY